MRSCTERYCRQGVLVVVVVRVAQENLGRKKKTNQKSPSGRVGWVQARAIGPGAMTKPRAPASRRGRLKPARPHPWGKGRRHCVECLPTCHLLQCKSRQWQKSRQFWHFGRSKMQRRRHLCWTYCRPLEHLLATCAPSMASGGWCRIGREKKEKSWWSTCLKVWYSTYPFVLVLRAGSWQRQRQQQRRK